MLDMQHTQLRDMHMGLYEQNRPFMNVYVKVKIKLRGFLPQATRSRFCEYICRRAERCA